MFLLHFDVYWTDARQHGIYLFKYNKETKYDTKRFLIQSLSSKHEKKNWRNLLSTQNKAISLVAIPVAMNCDWSKNFTPRSNFIGAGMETYIKSRIELQNLQILKKMLEMSGQFLSSERPSVRAEKLGRRLEYRRSSKIR